MPSSVVYVALPSFTENISVMRTACIELMDARSIVETIYQISITLYEKNIALEAIMVGVTEYFSLKTYCEERMWVSGSCGDLHIYDIKIIMDPTRDLGPRIPIFSFDQGMKVYAARCNER